jgi:hypothetical protein
MKPGGFALAKACTRMLEPDGQQYLQQWWGYQSGRKAEQHYREIFSKTGLLISRSNDVVTVIEKSSEAHLAADLRRGHTHGWQGLNAEYRGLRRHHFDRAVQLSPLQNLRGDSQALSIQHSMPLLSYETDGCAVSPAVLRQVDVHIQQVLEHSARTHSEQAEPLVR